MGTPVVVKQYWAVLLSLAALVGLYLTTVQLQATRLFWITAGGAAVITLTWRAAKKIRQLATDARKTAGLIRRVEQLEKERVSLQEKINKSGFDEAQTWKAGVQDGQRRTLGGITATVAKAEFTQVSSFKVSKGVVSIYARCSGSHPPSIGSWYDLVVADTGEVRGAVEVVEVSAGNNRVTLSCVDPTSPDFWQHLRDEGSRQHLLPSGLELRPYAMDRDPVRPDWGRLTAQANEGSA